jgi:hypothetical protein
MMATKQQEKQITEEAKSSRQQMTTVIGKNVLTALGHPGNLIRVQVRTLWGDYFRANVLVGPDVASVKIADSFFLSADASGNIVTCTPAIVKKYH